MSRSRSLCDDFEAIADLFCSNINFIAERLRQESTMKSVKSEAIYGARIGEIFIEKLGEIF